MCFLPKSRASMDQAPGPTIARMAPRTACMRGIHGSSECGNDRERAIDTSAIAASIPATGVHKPTRRSIPAPIPAICRTTAPKEGDSRMPTIPKWMSAAAVSSRRSRRPMPGQPSANVENSRCNTHTRSQRMRFVTGPKPGKVGPVYPSFRGSKVR
jgi:hypothetical protein